MFSSISHINKKLFFFNKENEFLEIDYAKGGTYKHFNTTNKKFRGKYYFISIII